MRCSFIVLSSAVECSVRLSDADRRGTQLSSRYLRFEISESTNVSGACVYLMHMSGFFSPQEQYAAHTIHVHGCIEPLMIIFKDNLIIIGLIAFGVGFVEVRNAPPLLEFFAGHSRSPHCEQLHQHNQKAKTKTKQQHIQSQDVFVEGTTGYGLLGNNIRSTHTHSHFSPNCFGLVIACCADVNRVPGTWLVRFPSLLRFS